MDERLERLEVLQWLERLDRDRSEDQTNWPA